jgi:alkylhydroperoxidase family enzyme
LPIAVSGTSERAAVLELKPEVWKRLQAALALSWTATDRALLASCRTRLAQLMDCRAELDAAGANGLGQLEGSGGATQSADRERAALAYTEQFFFDQNALSDEQKEAMARHLSDGEMINFVFALQLQEAYLRTLTLLDVAPDPGQSLLDAVSSAAQDELAAARLPSMGASHQGRIRALTHPAFRGARAAFGKAAVRESGVDGVTSELCRLRNANHQCCHY